MEIVHNTPDSHRSQEEDLATYSAENSLADTNDNFDASVAAYEEGDYKGGHALEQAAFYLDRYADEPNAYGFAQRAIELELGRGDWTDKTRRQAMELNATQRQQDDRPATTFESALTELREHATVWRDALNSNGSRDDQLNQEGVSLGYHINHAKRGDIESIDYLLETVEGLLSHRGALTEEQRGAEEYRDLRDALYRQKLTVQNTQETASVEPHKQREIDTALDSVRKATELDTEIRPTNETPHEPSSPANLPSTSDTITAMKERIDNVRILSGSEAEERLARNKDAFSKLPPEERQLRRRLADTMSMLGVTPADIGLQRGSLDSLSADGKSSMTTALKEASSERLQISGDAAVDELRGRLKNRILKILSTDTESSQSESNTTHTRNEKPTLAVDQSESAPLEDIEPQSTPTPIENHMQTVATNEHSKTTPDVAGLLRRYISPSVERSITDYGINVREVVNGIADGTVSPDESTMTRLSRFSTTYRNPQLLETFSSSLAGRAAEEARNELASILVELTQQN